MGEYLDEAFQRLHIELENPTSSNELFVRYGTAARTLDRFREELKINIPNPLEFDIDICVALIHQIRNVFAHNTVEPMWCIGERYRREYLFDDISISLIDLHNQIFSFDHVGGPESLFSIRKAFEVRI